jgi:hypothetical protein
VLDLQNWFVIANDLLDRISDVCESSAAFKPMGAARALQD